jgi:hypothetical protein
MEPQCEKEHIHLQNAEATQLMHDFLVAPQDHMEHPKRFSNSITNSLGMSASYLPLLCFSVSF